MGDGRGTKKKKKIRRAAKAWWERKRPIIGFTFIRQGGSRGTTPKREGGGGKEGLQKRSVKSAGWKGTKYQMGAGAAVLTSRGALNLF